MSNMYIKQERTARVGFSSFFEPEGGLGTYGRLHENDDSSTTSRRACSQLNITASIVV
jgi:hypothetical protein